MNPTNNGRPTDRPDRDLPDITTDLERILTDLKTATYHAETASDIWIAFSACQRSVLQLTAVLRAADTWLDTHAHELSSPPERVHAVRSRCDAYARELSETSRRRRNLAHDLAHLS